MRILFINKTSIHGGAEEVLLLYMLLLKEQGCIPCLLVPSKGWLTAKCDEHGIPFEVLASIPGMGCDSAWKQFKPLFFNAVKIVGIIAKRGIDIVHCNTPRLVYHAGIPCLFRRIPLIAHVHDIVDLPFGSKLKALLISTLSSKIVCVSDAVATEIVRQAPSLQDKTTTIYNGIPDPVSDERLLPEPYQKCRIRKNSIIICSASAMTPWKGQNVLIRAFGKLAPSYPDAYLFIVGASRDDNVQDIYESSLHDLASKVAGGDRIVFTGWREDVLDYIGNCDIFVHLPVKADPLPTVLLHASALSRPMLAARIGGIPEIVEDNTSGLLVDPDNVQAACDSMEKMLVDESLRVMLGAGARKQFLAKFTIDFLKVEIKNIFEACCSKVNKKEMF